MNSETVIQKLVDQFGSNEVRLRDINEYVKTFTDESVYKYLKPYRIRKGYYNFNAQNAAVHSIKEKPAPKSVETANSTATHIQILGNNAESYVPQKDPLFVGHGFYSKMKKIFRSNMFYPVFITGLSGNGKTFMVEQAAADSNKEMIRVNITTESDENQLLGGFRLINGETVWQDGPVVTAMKRGAILLLDEIDLASNKIMCLQPILEGKPYFNKQTSELVQPAKGFNIIATANTKGKGSDDGRFIGTNVLNEAFLERFPITVEQSYPTKATEIKILKKHFESVDVDDTEFVTNLVEWAQITRKTFEDGGIDELISTRRLGHIARAFSIFGKKLEAIQFCINRFDDETKTAFLELYTKIDAGVNPEDLELTVEDDSTY